VLAGERWQVFARTGRFDFGAPARQPKCICMHPPTVSPLLAVLFTDLATVLPSPFTFSTRKVLHPTKAIVCRITRIPTVHAQTFQSTLMRSSFLPFWLAMMT
jgi:hypothetical protein